MASIFRALRLEVFAQSSANITRGAQYPVIIGHVAITVSAKEICVGVLSCGLVKFLKHRSAGHSPCGK